MPSAIVTDIGKGLKSLAGTAASYGQSGDKSKDGDKQKQHRDYQPVLKGSSKDSGPDLGYNVPKAKHGAKNIRKSKIIKVHAGERVLTKKQAKKYSKKEY